MLKIRILNFVPKYKNTASPRGKSTDKIVAVKKVENCFSTSKSSSSVQWLKIVLKNAWKHEGGASNSV